MRFMGGDDLPLPGGRRESNVETTTLARRHGDLKSFAVERENLFFLNHHRPVIKSSVYFDIDTALSYPILVEPYLGGNCHAVCRHAGVHRSSGKTRGSAPDASGGSLEP